MQHISLRLARAHCQRFSTCPRYLTTARSAPPPSPNAYDRDATRHSPIDASEVEQPHAMDARFGPRDPERGRRATEEVVKGGKLDPRYRPAARRVLAIICATPIVIVLGLELFQRRFGGKEQKQAV